MAKIGINFDKKGDGAACSVGDWTTVHWVGRLKDGRVVTDSKMEGDQRPKTFTLGDH
jgi:FKBP-type peptidyl-prolyl cis-trans isomerase